MSRWGGRAAQQLGVLTLIEYGTICHLCGEPGADTPDHLVPRSHGGSDSIENLRPAHRSCNSSRSDLTLKEWFAKHPLPVDRVAPSFDWTSPPNESEN